MESIKEIAHKEEKQLFTIIATRVFPRNSDFVYSSAHDVSVSAVDSLMDLNWNDVQHRRGRNKCRNLGSAAAAAGCLLVARIWRLIDSGLQDTVSSGLIARASHGRDSVIPGQAEPNASVLWVYRGDA